MAVERPQFGQPLGPPTPTMGQPLGPRRPVGPPPPGSMPAGPPQGPPQAMPMPALPDPREARRQAIIEALGGPQVLPGSEVRSPDGPATQPRPFLPQDTSRRGTR